MADFEFDPPSFSLGFDSDIDLDPPKTPSSPPDPVKTLNSTDSRTIVAEEDDGFEYSGQVVADPPLVLRRLRKGSASQPKSREPATDSKDSCCRYNVDDEIEGFSSEEDSRGNLPSHSVCSSSKTSLHGQGALTSQCGSLWKSTERKGVSSVCCSDKAETNDIYEFSKLTASPLRRFQLIDSDSDPDSNDPPVSETTCVEVSRSTSFLKEIGSKSTKFASPSIPGTSKASIHNCEADLWKDFCPDKSFHIPTPAFDEVCDEFFKSRKSMNKSGIVSKDSNSENKLNMSTVPPSHHYFFHEDSRIQKLVRDRLPNFFPLGARNLGQEQQNAAVIDYMGQFSHESNSKQTSKRERVETSSSVAKKKVKKSNASLPQDSEDWVNPKSHGIPKDAGKRRVSAAGKSAGYWYTSSNGQKVYVGENGQKLTGNSAYRDYRKESGMGFKKSKKKASRKKKTASKKGTA